jgi:peptidoglycan/xylan/chitin deacetylase (PgdA/CDA1 family)
MHRLSFRLSLSILLSLALPAGLRAQARSVALTMDDLPFVPGHALSAADASAAIAANRRLLAAFARHHVPVTGFVIQGSVVALGPDAGKEILRAWVSGGFDLGNHSYAHPDLNDLSVAQFEQQILRGETEIIPLAEAAGRRVEFFRFPYNHTGDTKEKHDEIAAFLRRHGYRLAPCTIETSDYVFAAAYSKMLARHDRTSAARLRSDYLKFTAAQIDYFRKLNTQVLGYEPPEIMLIHDNQLNADVINKLLHLFEERHYRWLTLAQAEQDPAYQIPETFITSFGPMWGYRWARERGIKVNGALEPNPPQWIAEYGREKPAPPRRPRNSF